MTARTLPNDDVLYDTKTAAEFLRCSVSTLERHRLAGTGPSYHKFGPGKRAKVLYAQSALTAWLDKFKFDSTSQYER